MLRMSLCRPEIRWYRCGRRSICVMCKAAVPAAAARACPDLAEGHLIPTTRGELIHANLKQLGLGKVLRLPEVVRTPDFPAIRELLFCHMLGNMVKELLVISCAFAVSTFCAAQNTATGTRPRTAELGLKVGVLPTGPLDAITDVSGVEVGHTTIIHGENIRTGVTAILPHARNLYREKVPAGIFIGNGFGKLTGSTQVD